MDFIAQDYWNNSYLHIEIDTFIIEDSLINFIRKNVPNATEQKSMFEVGCFPGRYMTVFGEKGYEINGIDLTPRTHELIEVLNLRGFKVGEIKQGDFFYNEFKKYDIVCSFGFIEHFEQYLNVIEKHLNLVNDSGYILITTPNFRGIFQYLYHNIFDKKNLNSHNVESMRPRKWKNFIQKKGFEIISCGYIGNEIWRNPSERNNLLLRIIENLLIKFIKALSAIKSNNSFSSAYCIILAKKSIYDLKLKQ